MIIKVCVGSACHVKGAYDVIEKIQQYIKKEGITNIELKASFCLGKCTSQVSCEIEGEVYSVNKDNILDIIEGSLD